ncbi:Pre-mRNA-splicing factor SPF27 [Geopyxis carbonaria]|nr:Pre-mRNA-splicing factor SPF27 [Geopyxis carbonaria]
MSLIVASHDSLPYIEPAPSADELTAIANLIAAEVDKQHKTTLHPSLEGIYTEPRFSPLFQQELDRVSKREPFTGGIDPSRYEVPAAPTDTASTEAWNPVLQSSYALSAHLSSRLTNLSLLSEFGKNAWLIHNAQLEDLLKSLEEELMNLKTQSEVTNKERKGAQKDVEVDIRRLEDRWKKGIGKVLEVELATESVRREIIRRQQKGRTEV